MNYKSELDTAFTKLVTQLKAVTKNVFASKDPSEEVERLIILSTNIFNKSNDYSKEKTLHALYLMKAVSAALETFLELTESKSKYEDLKEELSSYVIDMAKFHSGIDSEKGGIQLPLEQLLNDALKELYSIKEYWTNIKSTDLEHNIEVNVGGKLSSFYTVFKNAVSYSKEIDDDILFRIYSISNLITQRFKNFFNKEITLLSKYSTIDSFLFDINHISRDLIKKLNFQITQADFLKTNEKIKDELVQTQERIDIVTKESESKNEEISELLEATKKEKDQLNEVLEETKKRLNAIENEISPLTIKVVAASQSKHFTDTAERFLEEKIFWRNAIIIWIILFSILLICFIKNGCFEFKCFYPCCLNDINNKIPGASNKLLNYEIFKALFFRALIVSVALILLRFLINNYRAAMHNWTINSHRANSLTASLSLTATAPSKETQEQIMVLVSNAIFSHQPTGYNSKEVENIQVVEKIFNKAVDKVGEKL